VGVRPIGPRAGTLLRLLLLAACSRSPDPQTLPSPSCALGDTLLVRETLYFGRNRPGGGTVSDAEWKSFLADVVTPRFPLGVTVLEATGQWKGTTGEVERERSEIVTLFHPDTEPARLAVQEIAREYKRRFQQEAVLRERVLTCARFE
jgi:NADPH-dependent 2,4-dienoyl-CoA reductase/sulfur reductase-like enzyme